MDVGSESREWSEGRILQTSSAGCRSCAGTVKEGRGEYEGHGTHGCVSGCGRGFGGGGRCRGIIIMDGDHDDGSRHQRCR